MFHILKETWKTYDIKLRMFDGKFILKIKIIYLILKKIAILKII